MEYAASGEFFRLPGLPDVFAEFDRPVLVLVHPEVGSVCLFGTGGVDGSPWTVDAEYVDQIGAEVNRVALVRTHRPVESRVVDRDPVGLLRSALSSLLGNELGTRAVVDAAVVHPAVVRIDGAPVDCLALEAGGCRGLVAEHGDVVVTVVLAVEPVGRVELMTVPGTA
ncbi:hypothetical protein [Lentzea aerocolonigenes]|uniref:hypothetical protein n=1 Tax=Lentzea aerocolonigenes TaxID=68170 RepID=UPI0004C3B8CC|nr:hypothetical protein [Lentzea aerocolonigenes]MCP2248386.1 hypothetical protein [Lentzea aerocolonigenes]